jgi:hypothetical protein
LLDNLATLVTDVDPHMDISETMEGIIEQVLEEVADPHFELNQGRHGTCVPTSIQWILVTYHPAEYVRLLAGLLTQAGRANLANGDTASVPIDTYRRDPLEDDPQVRRFLRRSWPERFFQAAMMSYARPGFTYSNIRDLFLQDVRGGLTDSEAVRLIGGLRNVAYNSQGGAGANLVNTIAQRLQAGSMPVLTTMRWDVPPNQGYHAVVSVAFDAANITFRNPWGRMDYRVGQLLANPPRTCSNPSRGEEAITRGDLANWIDTIIIEQP